MNTELRDRYPHLPVVIRCEKPWDKLYREIQVGSFICYGHLLGRSAGLRVGKVLGFKVRDEEEYLVDAEGKYWREKIWTGVAHGTNPIPPAGVLVVREWTISVIGLDNDSNRSWFSSNKPLELCSTKGNLQFPERCVIIEDTQVPQAIRDLLGPITSETNINKYIKSLEEKP